MKLILPLLGALITQAALAETSRWVSDPQQSSLEFIGTQEGAPFRGRFTSFNTGLVIELNDVGVDPGFEIREITTTIALASVDTQYEERDGYLKQSEWFNIAVFPEATFNSQLVEQQADGTWVATGTLELRGVKQDSTIQFSFDLAKNRERATLRGSGAVQRLQFDVGGGEWANTKYVGDRVEVEFDLELIRAFE